MNNDILFPCFITLYINENNKTCIYYFRGLNINYEWIYQQFNEDQLPTNTKIINDDGSIIYEFNNHISSIDCYLLSNFKEIPSKNIKIYNKS